MKRFGIFICVLSCIGLVQAETSIPLKEISPSSNSFGDKLLNIRMESASKCFFGDLDLILLDMQAGQKKLKLQLSVEPLPLGSGKAYYGDLKDPVDTTNRSSIGSFEVAIPSSEISSAFLVLLCSADDDQKNPKPCSTKTLIKPNDASIPYRGKINDLSSSSLSLLNPRPKGMLPDHKIYFSQLILSDNKTLKSTDRVLDSDSLENLLTPLGVEFSQTKKIYSDYEKYQSTLDSFPLQINQKDFSIILPYFDSDKCLKPRKSHTELPKTSEKQFLPGSTIDY